MITHLDNKMHNDYFDHWEQKWFTVNYKLRLPACGSYSYKTTTDWKKVDCLKCLKSKKYKELLHK